MNVDIQNNTPSRSGPFWAPTILALLYAATLAYAYLIYAPCDDTYIYLVYVKNQLAGNGLTFNGDKVQGFTSVLWTAMIWLVGKAGVDLPRAANALSAASALLVLIATYTLGRRLQLSRWRALIAPILLVTTGDFVFYTGNGLESVFFTGMLLVSIALLVNDKTPGLLPSLIIPFVLAITMLARPEGVLMGAVILGFMWWRTRDWFLVIRTGVLVVAIILPIQFALKSYYGYWLPNTYYAKSGAGLANVGMGLQYLTSFASYLGLFVVSLVFILALRFKALGPARWPLVTLLFVWIGHIVIQGGDNMVGYRALLPIVPLLYLLVVKGFEHVPTKIVAIGFVIACTSNVVMYHYGNIYGSSWNVPVGLQAQAWRDMYVKRVEIAEALKKRVEPGKVVALNAAGVIPYYSELKIIDMLGLNNEYLAHNGKRDRTMAYGHQVGDGDWVLSQKPDVILLGGGGSTGGNTFFGDLQITSNGDLVRYYNRKELPSDGIGFFRVTRPGRRRPLPKKPRKAPTQQQSTANPDSLTEGKKE